VVKPTSLSATVVGTARGRNPGDPSLGSPRPRPSEPLTEPRSRSRTRRNRPPRPLHHFYRHDRRAL